MNQSYLNGPLHELSKRFHPFKAITNKLFSGDHYLRLGEGVQLLGAVNWVQFISGAIHHLWSTPNGPVFIVKLWIVFMDILFGKLYSFNQNPICRNPNHSSVLSKKQNLGWFL